MEKNEVRFQTSHVIYKQRKKQTMKQERRQMLEVSELCKSYGKKTVLNNISFNIEKGRIIALVGANGAGKTTLFNIIAGLIRADTGWCRFDGIESREMIGKSLIYLPNDSYLIPFFTPRQMLMYINRICDLFLPNSDIVNTINRFNLTEFCDQKIKTLSSGMIKRTAIACTFMQNAKFIILDEPTNNIDTQTFILLKDEMNRLKSDGAIILISSHILDFVGAIADEVIFIKDGNIAKKVLTGDIDLEKQYIKLFDLPVKKEL